MVERTRLALTVTGRTDGLANALARRVSGGRSRASPAPVASEKERFSAPSLRKISPRGAARKPATQAVPAAFSLTLAMGDRGFEPRTSALSERRSNQLS
jgi:hypothetical protein